MRAWRHPSTAVKKTHKKRDELDKLLSKLITPNRVTPELWGAVFPNKVLIERYKKSLE